MKLNGVLTVLAALLSVAAVEAKKDKCNPVNLADDFVRAFNEKRFRDLNDLYTDDALVYANGDLDIVTKGRPLTVEQQVCVASQVHVRWEVESVARQGEEEVMLGLVAHVGGVERVDNRAGVGLVLEVNPGQCKVQAARTYQSTQTLGETMYTQALCSCVPEMAKYGLCGDVSSSAEVPTIDLVNRFQECWRYLEQGSAQGIAACFIPGAALSEGGVQRTDDASSVNYWDEYFQLIDVGETEFGLTFQDGFRLHVQLTAKLVNREHSQVQTVMFYQDVLFNEGGEIIDLDQAIDTDGTAFIHRARGIAPVVGEWETAAAKRDFVELYDMFGYPSQLHNSRGGFAYWDTAALANTDSCFVELWVADEAVLLSPVKPPAEERDTHIHTVSHLDVPDDLIDSVRVVTPSVTYDALKRQLHSRAYSLVQAKIDHWAVAQLVVGTLDLEGARLAWLQAVVDSENPENDVEETIDAELCNLLR